MFKKSDTPGDKTPKTERKDDASKETIAAVAPAPAADKPAEPAAAPAKS